MLNISERKNPLTTYGIEVNIKLMEQSKTQTWLIEQVQKKLPERFIDSSVINRVLTGRWNSPDVLTAINDVLGIVEH